MTSGHFWATTSAAAHRKHSPYICHSQLDSHNRSSQVGQTAPHYRHLAETHRLDSYSTFCPPPSLDVRGTEHLEHPPCRMLLLHGLDVAPESLWMQDVSRK